MQGSTALQLIQRKKFLNITTWLLDGPLVLCSTSKVITYVALPIAGFE